MDVTIKSEQGCPKGTKQETMKHLTDLMAFIANAYYKGRLGERNGEETDGDGAICGKLWVHECDSEHDAGISIDLYNFCGDGRPVCDGLNPYTFTFDDGSTDTGHLYCINYDPDDVNPLVFAFSPNDESDDYDIKPEDVSEDVLKNITAWLEGMIQQMPVKVEECGQENDQLEGWRESEKQKASQVLQYMENEMDAKTVLQVLNPYLKDGDLAGIYDRFVKDGMISEEGYC